MPQYIPGRYVAIDIGTVTCRLYIADVDENGAIESVARDREMTHLGVGVDATGVLQDDAIDRVIVTMQRFQKTIRDCSFDKDCPLTPTIIATSASRDAKNADEFARRMREIGLELTVIPGTKEAALSFLGASRAFLGERVMVVDSGGGSTEVVAGLAGGVPEKAHSFNIGCRRITDRFLEDGGAGPIDEARMEEARVWARKEMTPYFQELKEARCLPARMVAVAGTATTAVAVRDEMEVYDRARVNGATVTKDDLDAIYRKLAVMTADQRGAVAGLEPSRANVICSGFATLQVVLDLAGLEVFTVSTNDILQGIVLDAARAV